jgi:ADP-L-glycero-D-manno-heptose 6-epimerase
MIVITGAYGFIGSYLLQHLSNQSNEKIVIVDDFSKDYKAHNLDNKSNYLKIERSNFIDWLSYNYEDVNEIYHLGARTDTTEQDESLFENLNINFSKDIWKLCVLGNIKLVYASSAATYGGGEFAFDDNHDLIPKLQPLNPYGWSKQIFDLWVLEQKETPPQWIGLKFFNVYGPNEYHKQRMASVIFHSHNKIKASGEMQLFKSHKEGIADGQQSRDFIYVKDIANICEFCMSNKIESGIYNAGTGQARSFLDLTKATFKAMGIEENISFIDTPIDIRDTYQYFTQANMTKLFKQGYKNEFSTLEAGIEDYVKNYLIPNKYF